MAGWRTPRNLPERRVLSVYPPAVLSERDGPNPMTVAGGDEVELGSCTYRLDISEEDDTVTMVPIKEPTPGELGQQMDDAAALGPQIS